MTPPSSVLPPYSVLKNASSNLPPPPPHLSLLIAGLVQRLDIADKIRGFSTNVANYQVIRSCPLHLHSFSYAHTVISSHPTTQPLGIACPSENYCLNGQHQSDPCCDDPCK